MNFLTSLLLLSFVGVGSQVSAHEKKKGHRHHHAHVHGAGELKIVFEKLQGKIEFKSAADSVLGFEHEAKSEKDLKVFNEAKERFQNQASQMIQLSADLGCTFATEKVDVQREGSHADFFASYKVDCQKSPLGSELKLDFTFFKRMKDLDVTILVDDVQISAEAKRKPVTVILKN